MDDIPIDGKNVIVRADLNVSVGEDGVVDANEDFRIEMILPTIEELVQRRCKVLILAHRGRPRENKEDVDMTPIRKRLEYLLRESVTQTNQFFGDGVRSIISGMSSGSVLLLPNIRLDHREESVNLKLGEELASIGEAYINEAFSVSHRAHASVTALPHLLPSCAGRRTVIEVRELEKLRDNPVRPYVAITSGAKISTKIGLLRTLLGQVDALCLGGQLANVFLAVQAHVESHNFSVDEITAAQSLLEQYGEKIILPVDVVIGDENGENARTVSANELGQVKAGIWDIGPKSIAQILEHCRLAQTIMWNGPVGKFEIEKYALATTTLVREIAKLPARRVVGGGDTVIVIEREKLLEKYDHVSVGGGAMVTFLEGARMPGLEPLYNKDTI